MSCTLPASVYRLQLHKDFPFSAAKNIIPYLLKLGIQAIYTSPILQASKNSSHGYNVENAQQINRELGGNEAFEDFCKEAQKHKLQVYMDIVPNHMGITGTDNHWWQDVLKNGQESKYQKFFDIDWDMHKGKLFLPLLGEKLETVLENKELEITEEHGQKYLTYYSLKFPLKDGTHEDSDDITEIIKKQSYLPVFWKRAAGEINYRRYFDINELAAIKMEDDEVFTEYHKFIFELIDKGLIQGLRLDHPDGLYDPEKYFTKLRAAIKASKHPDTQIIIERTYGEKDYKELNWDVDGTVGYEMLRTLNSLFINFDAKQKLYKSFCNFISLYDNKTADFDIEQLIYDKKKAFILSQFTAVLKNLSSKLKKAPFKLKNSDDEIFEVLLEVFANFPAFRTYISSEKLQVNKKDKDIITEAFSRAFDKNSSLDVELANKLKAILLLEGNEIDKKVGSAFALKFQQLTGPVAAKAIEDTVFYIYNVLPSLNELGCEPFDFKTQEVIKPIDDFHKANKLRLKHQPKSFSSISTHDTKRSFDLRMRLNVLSELTEKFEKLAIECHKLNVKFKSSIDEQAAPDLNTEYFIYQHLIAGIENDFNDVNFQTRFKDYILKAMKEAKLYTSWVEPNKKYETAVFDFIDHIFLPQAIDFQKIILPFALQVKKIAQQNALAALNLQYFSPGIVDLYQGTELWDYSYVDPDNRREINYTYRAELLEQKEHEKLNLIHEALLFRTKHSDFVLHADYKELELEGPAKDFLVAFIRESDSLTLLCISLRLKTLVNEDDLKQSKILIPEELKDKAFSNIYSGAKIKTLNISVSDLLEQKSFAAFCA